MGHTLPLRTALPYAAGDVGPSLTSLCLAFFWLYFLIQVAGLPPLEAGLIQGSGFVFSATASLWAGHWLDRHARTPGSRLRLIAGAGVGLAMSFAMLWIVPPVGAWRAAWYLAFSWLFHFLFAFVYLAYLSLAALLASDVRERVDLHSWRFGGSMLLGVLLLALFAATGAWPMDRRLLMLAVTVSALAAAGSLSCGLGLRRALIDVPTRDAETPAAWIDVVHSPVLWRAIGANLAVWFIVQSVLVLTVFLCAAAGIGPAVVLVTLQLSIVSAMLLVSLAVRRVTPETVLRASAALWCAGALLWLEMRAPVAAAICLGLGLGAGTVLTWTWLPEALEAYAAAAHVRVEARAYAGLTVLRDLVSGLVPVLAAFALDGRPIGSHASGRAAAFVLVAAAVLTAALVIGLRLPVRRRSGDAERVAAQR